MKQNYVRIFKFNLNDVPMVESALTHWVANGWHVAAMAPLVALDTPPVMVFLLVNTREINRAQMEKAREIVDRARAERLQRHDDELPSSRNGG